MRNALFGTLPGRAIVVGVVVKLLVLVVRLAAGSVPAFLGVVDSVAEQPKRVKLALSFQVTNQQGKVVLKGASTGMILRAG